MPPKKGQIISFLHTDIDNTCTKQYKGKVIDVVTYREADKCRFLSDYKKPWLLRSLVAQWNDIKKENPAFAEYSSHFILCDIYDFTDHFIWFAITIDKKWQALNIKSINDNGFLIF